MGTILVFGMIAGGILLALAVGIPIAAAQRESGAGQASAVPPDRNHLASSLLFNLMLAGGTTPDQALRELRRVNVIAPVTSAVDVTSWAERFAQLATPEQRAWLLDIAVQLVAARSKPVPVRQYAVLLDLSFGLGFQTDALAKLRQQYGFEYVDHAKEARPRSADRAGGATPLFVRDTRGSEELLRVLGIEGQPSRTAIVAAYRRLAAQHHPDRVFAESAEVQSAAAARFIEITQAYEALLAIYRD